MPLGCCWSLHLFLKPLHHRIVSSLLALPILCLKYQAPVSTYKPVPWSSWWQKMIITSHQWHWPQISVTLILNSASQPPCLIYEWILGALIQNIFHLKHGLSTLNLIMIVCIIIISWGTKAVSELASQLLPLPTSWPVFLFKQLKWPLSSMYSIISLS